MFRSRYLASLTLRNVRHFEKPASIEKLPKLDKKIAHTPLVFLHDIQTELDSREDKSKEALYDSLAGNGSLIVHPFEGDFELCRKLIDDRHAYWDPLISKRIFPNETFSGETEEQLKKDLELIIEECKTEGADFISFESFSTLKEAEFVLDITKKNAFSSVLTFKSNDDGKLKCGTHIVDACEALDENGVFMVGYEGTPEFVRQNIREIRRAVGCRVGVIMEYDRSREYSEKFWGDLCAELHFLYATNYFGISGGTLDVLKEIREELRIVPAMRGDHGDGFETLSEVLNRQDAAFEKQKPPPEINYKPKVF